MRFLSVCSGIEAASKLPNATLHVNAVDLTGARLGRLMVLRPSGTRAEGHLKWLCACDCGSSKEIASNSLTRAQSVQSCGCMNKTVAQRKRRVNGAWNDGKSYAIKDGEHCYRTRHAWAKAAIRHYGNKCERCGWDTARCDVHHREHKSAGGLHTLANAIVLCPNCHRVEHERARCDS